MSVTQTVLNEMDWGSGFAIPVANSENKNLEVDVFQRREELERAKRELEHTDDRVHSMLTHLANVKQELRNCEGLLEARNKELESEDHMKKISDRELGRLQHEITRIKQESHTLLDRKSSKEQQIFSLNQEFDSLKGKAQMDQKALEIWLEESARRDEDMIALSKYMRQDEEKIKELTLEVERLTKERDKRHKQLATEATETQMAQVELDRIGEDFRRAHRERQDLIKQWENTVNRMQKRDKEMEELAEELQGVKDTLAGRDASLREKRLLLDNHISSNRETEQKITTAERLAAKIKLELQDSERAYDVLQSELAALRRMNDRTSSDLESARAHLNQLRQQLLKMGDTLEKNRDETKLVQEKLRDASSELLTAEESANQLEIILKEQEREQQLMEVRLKKLRETEFKRTQDTQTLLDQEKSLIAAIQGSQATLRNLQSRIRQLDAELLKQQGILYQQDFILGRLESRLARMQGETNSEEKNQLQHRIAELQGIYEQTNETYSTMTGELKYLSEELRRTQRTKEITLNEQQNLTEKINELELFNDSTVKLLKKLTRSKEDVMVEDNLLKLEVKRLQSLLMAKSADVLSLQKRQMELEQLMKERMKEIGVHYQMLQAQMKTSEEERQQIAAELGERNSKIEKLQKRYEIITVTMTPPEGEEEHSQAYYVIKAAQEREDLQRRGDELDAQIRKTEKELRAMENTIRMVNDRNDKLKRSVTKVQDNSEEVAEKEALEAQFSTAMEKLRLKRQRLNEVEGDLRTMRATMETLEREGVAQISLLNDRRSRISAHEKDLGDQKDKVDRAMKLITKLRKDIRTAKKVKEKTVEEIDIELRERRDFNKAVLASINESIQASPEMGPIISMHFHDAGLPPPNEMSSSAAPSETASVASSRSSRASFGGAGSVRSSVSGTSGTLVRTTQVTIGQDLPGSGTSSPGGRGSGAGSAVASARSSQASGRKKSSPSSSKPASPGGSKVPSVQGSKPPSVAGSKPPSVSGSKSPSVAGSGTASPKR